MSFVQPRNAPVSTLALIGIFIERRAEQLMNDPHPIDVTEAGRTMVSRDEQLLKVKTLIDEIEFGSVTEVKDLQELKT